MSNIVVLSSVYLGKSSTNGLCAKNIVHELIKQGNEVDVVCYRNEGDDFSCEDAHIVTIENSSLSPNIINRIGKGISLIKRSTSFFLDQAKVKRYFDAICSIGARKRIDAIVAFFFPLESAEALRLYKEKNSSVKAIIYELDSIGDGIASNSWLQRSLDGIYKKWQNLMYATVDKIIIMESHREYWKASFSNKFGDKCCFSDIPVFLRHTQTSKDITTGWSFVYAGIIEKKYRSPYYLLDVLEELSRSVKFDFCFF